MSDTPRTSGRPRLVDLTHPVEHGMVTYPGLPGPQIGDHMSWEDSRDRYAPGTEFQIGRITMVANTGTYLDAPAHRHRGRDDLAALALTSVAALPGLVVRASRDVSALDVGALRDLDVEGRAVLVHTGWDRHWRREAYGAADAPFVTKAAATWLAGHGAALVGIDSVNIDSTLDDERPAHTVLLAAGIPVLEHLTGLADLPDDGFELHAAPVPVRGMGTFPVRAYAVVRAL